MSAFTYWDSVDIKPISPAIAHWQAEMGDFGVVGDSDVIKALEEIDPSAIEMYEKIRIPAARSDVARLVILYRNGGLYVDSHCGVTDAKGVRDILCQAYTDCLILVDQSRASRPRPVHEIFPINAMIAGGKGGPLLRSMIERVIGNLRAKRRDEAIHGFRPYDLLQLTGPKNIGDALSAYASQLGEDNDADLTLFQEDDFAVQRYRYKLSADRSAHWSERQKTEFLFDN